MQSDDRVSKSIGRFLPFAVLLSIAVFGLIINVMLFTVNLTSTQIQAAAYVQYQLNKEFREQQQHPINK